jgi:hypothetical protein
MYVAYRFVTLYSTVWLSNSLYRAALYAYVSRGFLSCRSLKADFLVPIDWCPKRVSTSNSTYSGIWSLEYIESNGRIPHTSTCTMSEREMNMKSICCEPCL